MIEGSAIPEVVDAHIRGNLEAIVVAMESHRQAKMAQALAEGAPAVPIYYNAARFWLSEMPICEFLAEACVVAPPGFSFAQGRVDHPSFIEIPGDPPGKPHGFLEDDLDQILCFTPGQFMPFKKLTESMREHLKVYDQAKGVAILCAPRQLIRKHLRLNYITDYLRPT